MVWRRESRAGRERLAEERTALAERYTIDADEARRREQLAVEAAAKAAEEARRPRLGVASSPELEPNIPSAVETSESQKGSRVTETEPEEEEATVSPALPIYRWLDGTQPPRAMHGIEFE
jgi:hypothetical protein